MKRTGSGSGGGPRTPSKQPKSSSTRTHITEHKNATLSAPADARADAMEPPVTPKPLVFNPRRSPSNVIMIQGLSPAPGKGKGKGKGKGRLRSGDPAVLGAATLEAVGIGTDHEQVKKLVIKNARRTAECTGEANARFARMAEEKLVKAVKAITAVPSETASESLQTLFGLCEGLVSQGPAPSQKLYDALKAEFQAKSNSIHETVGSSILTWNTSTSLTSINAADVQADAWFARLESEWRKWLEQLLMIRSVFLHLDRTYVLSTSSLLSIWDLGLAIFRDTVILPPETSQGLTNSLLSLILRERQGLSIPRPLLRSVLALLHSLSPEVHQEIFLTPFLAATSVFYGSEAAAYLRDESAPIGGEAGYLALTKRRLAEEAERLDAILAPSVAASVKPSVEALLHDRLIAEQSAIVLERGLPVLLFEYPASPTAAKDLAILWGLFTSTGRLHQLRVAFGECIKSTGYEIVKDPARDESMVESLIEFKRKVDGVVRDAFGGGELMEGAAGSGRRGKNEADKEIAAVVKESFEAFMNRRQNKPAEMIAKYLDAKLRLGSRGMTEAELEDALNYVLTLFRHTQGKDVFEAFYKRDLGKRLLLGKSVSADAERSMLLRLKNECGPGFTVKLETMFKDIEVSADLAKAYRDGPGAGDPIDLSVSVLTTGNWPPYPQCDLALPRPMTSVLDRFKWFYIDKHSGRKLTWAHALDHCVLTARFPKGGRKELAVSLHQCLALLLFNDVEPGATLGFQEIVEQTGIPPKEAARTLQSLACGKVRVLTKSPKGRDVNPDDEFAFNVNFKDDHFRIKINQIQQKETNEEQKATTDRVFMDRASHLQLAIVRILKSRKVAKHSELVMEVIGQIKDRFKVEPREVKVAIEGLIAREYLERVKDSRDTYRYLA